MQIVDEALNRRSFLKLGAAGLAAAGAESLLPRVLGEEQGTRPAPSHPVTLRSAAVELLLDPDDGVPYEYRLRRSGVRFAGEGFGQPLKATVHSKAPFGFATVAVRPAGNRINGTTADFHFTAFYASNAPAADFTLRYALEGSTVRVTLEDVRERDGFEFISLSMPSLVVVSESEDGAWLAHGDSGGDLVALSDAKAGKLRPNTFWGEINGILPVIMTGHSGAVCVQETTAYMDGTLLEVSGSAPNRRAAMGTTKVYRVDGSACYDMNLGREAPKSCDNQQTPNLIVEQKSSMRLDFLEPEAGRRPTWIDGAKLVRARMPAIPSHFYDDKFIYGIRTDEPTFPQPSATFEHCEEMIRDMHALTDGSPQLVHLWGWQFRGKDTGYPAVNVVDERIGGYEGMMRLMERAKRYNATVSLSDNYDDAYRSSPAWDEEMIARKPDGELWKSRNWTGEVSYIQGLAKYMEGPGVERVRYTCERYKLPGTVHVDVLSYFAIRNDWDPKHPASGIRNLEAGRYRILDEFKKHGVDVTSEGLRYPYIGRMSMCWYAGGPAPCPFGGKPVPMMALVYRKSTTWGRAGNRGDLPLALMMFNGESQHSIFNGTVSIAQRLDAFYLAMVPWFRLHTLNIEGFERMGDKTVTTLEGESNRVEIDWARNGYSVSFDGAEVARDSATFCPLGNDRIAMYAVADGPLTATLPTSWNPADIAARSLFADRKEAVKFEVSGRKVAVQMQARRPVMLYRTQSLA
ncbi:endo-alpha-N-acetylgalactosaminidase family protein [Edaphobacter aggregans]|uniref:endo-alpha-N-acetylgalactosaminidase family protein n=1 Tax=Edaphobacter aggregans TaxID=570835 RepID=UPI000554666B|nr:endo-alpha-N-acetylgalactosaminidase family protein [Edaphobacter aggregans]